MNPLLMVRDGTCRSTRRRLSDLIDGALVDPERTRVRRHLSGCRRCRRVEASLRHVVDQLHELGTLPPPVRPRTGFQVLGDPPALLPRAGTPDAPEGPAGR